MTMMFLLFVLFFTHCVLTAFKNGNYCETATNISCPSLFHMFGCTVCVQIKLTAISCLEATVHYSHEGSHNILLLFHPCKEPKLPTEEI